MSSLKRILSLLGGAMLMIAVALFSAFLALRIAIHGREVQVPLLEGRTDAEATAIAKDLGLNLTIENRFYSSAVSPNRVLSQSPVAGSRVRSGWRVRITESLGPQQVAIPNVTGLTDRPASVMLRRLQLQVSSVAHLPAPGPAGIVLAQSPPPNSSGLNGPNVSLLVSDDEAPEDDPAWTMPSLVGLSLTSAALRLGTAGLHIASVTEPGGAAPAGQATAQAFPDAAAPQPYLTPQAFSVNATIASQSPAPGHRVTRADTIRVTLSH